MSMNKKTSFALAASAAMTAGLALSPMAFSADNNPFASTELSNGYIQLAEGSCGEGKCGEDAKGAEGKCGEGKCGEDGKDAEGKCGEGKCGEDGKDAEGKCGEGKCGS